MNTAIRIDWPMWRNESAPLMLRIDGLNLAGHGLLAEVRRRPDQPGPALAVLADTGSATVTGVRLADTGEDNGVPFSVIALQLPAAARKLLPYDGAIGEPTRLAYALQIDGETRFFGDIILNASPIGGAGAPATRPVGEGPNWPAGSLPGTPVAGRFSFGNQEIRVSISFGGAPGAPGARGQAGADGGSLGGFVELGGIVALPTTVRFGYTDGFHLPGVGNASYAHDPALTPAFLDEFPNCGFRATGDRVFRLLMPTIDIDQLGCRGDCTAPGQNSDDYARIDEGRRLLSRFGTGTLLIPNRKYRVGQRLKFTEGIRIVGQGHHPNPGVYGNPARVNTAGLAVYDGSMLVWDPGVSGMIFYDHTDTDDSAAAVRASQNATGRDSPYYKHKGARWSELTGVALFGGFGAGRPVALEMRTNMRVVHNMIREWAGDGIKNHASTHTEPDSYGNSDQSWIAHNIVREVFGHAIWALGNEVNVTNYDSNDTALCGGVGLLNVGQLGDATRNHHAASSNLSHPATVALGIFDAQYARHRAALVAEARYKRLDNVSILDDQYAGNVSFNSPIGAHRADGCYAESGLGWKSYFGEGSLVTGGNIADNAALTADSKGLTINGAGEIVRGHLRLRNRNNAANPVGLNLGSDQPNEVLSWGSLSADPGNQRYNELKLRYAIGEDKSYVFEQGNSPFGRSIGIFSGESTTNGGVHGPYFPQGFFIRGPGFGGPVLFDYGNFPPTSGTAVRGQRRFLLNESPGGRAESYCTTPGTIGSTAVFKGCSPIDS